MNEKKVIVIGAGVAGLASAIRLQHAGYSVSIYEKESMPGGKMHRIDQDGYQFDLGPSIVMMPEIYREVFELCGRDPDDYIPMEKLDPMYSVYFRDRPDEPYHMSSDMTSLMETLESFGDEDSQGFFDYLNEIYKRFIVARDHFIQKPFRHFSDFYNPSTLKQALKLKTFDSADHFISKYIKNDRLKEMISFQTLYIGISPFNGPSLYTMIPMIEFLYGVWFIKGGMYTMAQSMERLFLELGGTVHYNANVEEIRIVNEQAKGILVNNQDIDADYVVCNADFPYAMKHLVLDTKAKGKYTDRKIDNMKYSCSCFLMYLGMDKKYDDIDHVHNFFFNDNLEQNLNDIFAGNKLTDASFYVYIASKMDPSLAPEGKDGLYILVPVSDLSTAKYEWNDETIQYYRDYVLNSLKSIKGFEQIDQEIVSESYTTPIDFAEKFNAYNGACFGLQPTLSQSNHMRPQSKAKNCENLYFTGSSTHPGAGVPIVLLSAKIAVEELLRDDEKTVAYAHDSNKQRGNDHDDRIANSV
ncbi:phytoene desaturase family protein [Lentibacillus saliphilus]|uniref:phytoene desaturase family protein n=1 Tax=Lentibacillus saliphilus TaxID=2737028 RepID=UPI001C2F19C5|nr:phytoene desaturase family protein [Lentibacillus saliphilus]